MCVEVAGEGATSTVWRAESGRGRRGAQGREEDDGWVGREAALLAGLAAALGAGAPRRGARARGRRGARARRAIRRDDWVDGEPLEREPSGRSDGELAAIVAHGVGRALDELHALGVRHGDVKPANVLVGEHEAHARQRRRARRDAHRHGARRTRDSGEAASGGTPRYLAPEVRRGEPATPAADLYALGLVLAEVLDPAIARRATL